MKSKRYMGIDLHRNCFTVYTRQEDGSGESLEWSIRSLKTFAKTVKASDEVAVEATALARKFLGIIYKTLKNNWVFEDFPNFVLVKT